MLSQAVNSRSATLSVILAFVLALVALGTQLKPPKSALGKRVADIGGILAYIGAVVLLGVGLSLFRVGRIAVTVAVVVAVVFAAVWVGLRIGRRSLTLERPKAEAPLPSSRPSIRIGRAYVAPLPPFRGEPGKPRWIARVTIVNDSPEDQAVDVSAQAKFLPQGETAAFHAYLKEHANIDSPSIDCRWSSTGDGKPSGPITLNPRQERDLDIAMKSKWDPYAYAYDDRANQQTADGRLKENKLYEGSYQVKLVVSGKGFSKSSTLLLHNDGIDHSLRLEHQWVASHETDFGLFGVPGLTLRVRSSDGSVLDMRRCVVAFGGAEWRAEINRPLFSGAEEHDINPQPSFEAVFPSAQFPTAPKSSDLRPGVYRVRWEATGEAGLKHVADDCFEIVDGEVRDCH